jgi:hypothetical protein
MAVDHCPRRNRMYACRTSAGQDLEPTLGAQAGDGIGEEHVGQLEIPDAGGGVAKGLEGYRVNVGRDHTGQDAGHGWGAADRVGVSQRDGTLRTLRIGQCFRCARDELHDAAGRVAVRLALPASECRRTQE